jgi:hypothetical protein
MAELSPAMLIDMSLWLSCDSLTGPVTVNICHKRNILLAARRWCRWMLKQPTSCVQCLASRCCCGISGQVQQPQLRYPSKTRLLC